MNNGTTFANALTQGFNTGVQLYRDDADAQLRREALKKQLDAQASESEMRRALEKRRIEIDQQRANDSGWEARSRDAQAWGDRADRLSLQQLALRRQVEADAYARDPNNPHNKLANAQAGTQLAKPVTAIGAQVAGMDEFADAMAKANAEHQEAQAAAQTGDPTAQQRVVKAQMKLSGLSELGKTLLKQAKPTSIVKIRRKSDDDSTSEELEVPADQWNEQHPAWQRFNPAPAAPAAGKFPTPPPAAIALLKSNPAMRAQFEAKYGPGSAAAALR